VKFVTYNIQYALGKDKRFDIERIAEAVRGADVIGLQEVERNWPRPGIDDRQTSGVPDQPAELARLLPQYYWVYEPAFDMDASEMGGDGAVVNRRRQHGVMLLSRTPILSVRRFNLPKMPFRDVFNMQMGALEGVIVTDAGPLRVYVLHLGYLVPDERHEQLDALFQILRRALMEGGVWTGPSTPLHDSWTAGRMPPPMPREAVLLGDFNLTPDTAEYARMTGPRRRRGERLSRDDTFVDSWVAAGRGEDEGVSWIADPDRKDERDKRIDYCFVSPALAERVTAAWIDEEAQGSDHQPVWAELEL
jgi:endonuclease/exonuclease/phosphatase family metal-dependent hydrolase